MPQDSFLKSYEERKERNKTHQSLIQQRIHLSGNLALIQSYKRILTSVLSNSDSYEEQLTEFLDRLTPGYRANFEELPRQEMIVANLLCYVEDCDLKFLSDRLSKEDYDTRSGKMRTKYTPSTINSILSRLIQK